MGGCFSRSRVDEEDWRPSAKAAKAPNDDAKGPLNGQDAGPVEIIVSRLLTVGLFSVNSPSTRFLSAQVQHH